MELHRSHQAPEAYWFKIYSTGKWELLIADSIAIKGWVKLKENKACNIKLFMKENLITAFINQKVVARIFNSKYNHGLCGLGSNYDKNLFDNFSIKAVP